MISFTRPPAVSVTAHSTILALVAVSFVFGSTTRTRAADGAGGGIEFLRDVRPILSSHCFKCHGPDEKARKGGLRLDVREDATKPAKSGKPAFVPGRPAESELVRRLETADEDDVMPPASTKHPLTASQKETLRRWVVAGAEYQPHWAFVPPRRPAVPEAPTLKSGVKNPIDAFVFAGLEKDGLKPSPEAGRLTLVRRLYFDLIGLPPTPEEADAFVNDPAPNAYERLVDRLLESRHYGERWARRWMDLARYADTNGYEKDRVRSMWPWRDWLIRSLNDDLPFDQFTIQQVAGDLLPDAGLPERIATGFNRNTMINEEGGIDPLEYRFYAMVDRVHTTATTWLGMTMACAQCHTHKYDPIQHREYYQFMAFLDNADEPEIDVPQSDLAARREEMTRRADALEAGLQDRFPYEERLLWITPPAVEATAASGATLERLDDGSFRAGGPAPERDTYTLVFDTALTSVTRLNLDALADDALPSRGPGRTANGNFVLSELEVTASPREGSAAPVRVVIGSATTDFEQSSFPVRNAFDGKTNTGWAISRDKDFNLNRRATFRFESPAGFAGGTRFTVKLVQAHGLQHVLGRLRISLGVEEPDPRPLEERRREHFARRFKAWSEREAGRVRAWTPLRPFEAKSKVPVLTIQEDASVVASSDMTKSDTYELRFRTGLKGITALRLEAMADDRLPKRGPGRVYYEGPFGDFYLSTFAVSSGGQPVKLARATQTHASGGNTAEKAIDDDQQTGWSIDGGQGRTHVAVFNLDQPLTPGADGEIGLSMLFERYYAAGLGRFRISATTDPRGAEAFDLPDDMQAVLARPIAERTPEERARLEKQFVGVAPELTPAREEIAKLRRELPKYPTTLALSERPASNPRPTFQRHRGEYLQPTDRVTAGLPATFSPFVREQPTNRLAFARWLVSRENPLTARVMMNRHWSAFFGRGLVRTMEDFGFQGELPTHPDLLDWMAVEFMDSGWSQKRMHKLIVTSATYRQSSHITTELLDRDPLNRFYARGPRFRIDGELVRDFALRASGLLSSKIGGPSVFPPQLASITREGTYGPLEWKVSEGEDRYRRGLYTFAKRTAPYATFGTFDAPSGEACVARREVSNTPLQSLTLLNDEVFVEAAQALGRQAAALDGDTAHKATFLFRRTLTRPPTAEELSRILAFHEAQNKRLVAGELKPEALAGKAGTDAAPATERAAWTAVARALLNLDETVTRG